MNSGKAVALAVLMAVGLLFASPSQMFPAMAGSSHPAGCHEHGQLPSNPQPLSYDCCRTGHNTAILQEIPGPRAALVVVARTTETEFALPAVSPFDLMDVALATSPPPGLTPLRI
ncbi:MAG TPA: hypothetical protein VLW84_12635 [Terriglobales bacterium]|nr:hypothetical protein [Terriglobales bacterium]